MRVGVLPIPTLKKFILPCTINLNLDDSLNAINFNRLSGKYTTGDAAKIYTQK